MPKHKAGLHKEISSIFKGVPLKQDDDTAPGSGADAPQPPRRTFSKLPVLERQEPNAAEPKMPTPQTEPPRPEKSRPQEKPSGPSALQKVCERIKNKLLAQTKGVSNSRQKTMVVLVPIMAVVLIVVLFNVLRAPSANTAAKPSGFGPAGAFAASAASSNEINWQRPPAYPETLRDPTQFGPAATAQARLGSLTVRGIVYSNDPSAVIGTRIVRTGDEISGAKVIKINQDSVEFEMNGERWTQKVQR